MSAARLPLTDDQAWELWWLVHLGARVASLTRGVQRLKPVH